MPLDIEAHYAMIGRRMLDGMPPGFREAALYAEMEEGTGVLYICCVDGRGRLNLLQEASLDSDIYKLISGFRKAWVQSGQVPWSILSFGLQPRESLLRISTMWMLPINRGWIDVSLNGSPGYSQGLLYTTSGSEQENAPPTFKWPPKLLRIRESIMNAACWFTLVSVGAVLTAAPVFSNDRIYDQCMEDSRGVTVAMLDCIGPAYEKSDDALNDLWMERLALLGEAEGSLLRKAQRDWIAYRNSTCDAEAYMWGDGSFVAVALADCRLRITQERLNWLKDIPQSEGGNRR